MSSPRKVKFIVGSAGEAVQRVRAELGTEARVISVRQVKGSGLQRFLAAPKLEIIAQGPPLPEPAPQDKPPTEEPAPSSAELKATPKSAKESPAKVLPKESAKEEKVPGYGPLSDRASRSKAAAQLTCRKFLEQAGFGEPLIARLDGSGEWREIMKLPVGQGMTEAVRWLRAYRSRIQEDTQLKRAAFIGGGGSGKTTAICKLLARDVFLNGQQPEVLRLEVDKPHLDDGLVLYCEALGIRCLRRKEDLGDYGQPVYVDIPGISLREPVEHQRLEDALVAAEVSERILVSNAAYEREVMQKFCDLGDRLGADFHIYTHVDELDQVGKLWERILDPERTVLFFSDGQNVAADRVEDTFGFLMERTFPR